MPSSAAAGARASSKHTTDQSCVAAPCPSISTGRSSSANHTGTSAFATETNPARSKASTVPTSSWTIWESACSYDKDGTCGSPLSPDDAALPPLIQIAAASAAAMITTIATARPKRVRFSRSTARSSLPTPSSSHDHARLIAVDGDLLRVGQRRQHHTENLVPHTEPEQRRAVRERHLKRGVPPLAAIAGNLDISF